MDSGNQQIVYYFIEEAKEHLDTLEKGLVDLNAVMEDQERVNEMFRAAHSVKGGAAMLGFDSIKAIAHRLEDCFKILKDHPVSVDQKLESMFLKGCDTLKDLVERLEGPFGLQEEEAAKTVQQSEPNFAQLQAYLNHLVSGGGAAVAAPTAAPAQAIASVKTNLANFVPQVMDILKEMLQLFKGSETPATRQKLEELCNRLLKLGADIQTWQALVQTAHRAIANPKNAYRTLAPVVIKELKQASEQVTSGQASAIAASPALQQLGAPAAPAAPKQITAIAEPRAAAKALLQAFDRKQLTELIALLQGAMR